MQFDVRFLKNQTNGFVSNWSKSHLIDCLIILSVSPFNRAQNCGCSEQVKPGIPYPGRLKRITSRHFMTLFNTVAQQRKRHKAKSQIITQFMTGLLVYDHLNGKQHDTHIVPIPTSGKRRLDLYGEILSLLSSA